MLKEWASLYTSSEDLAVKGLYLACDITPYVHAITSHLPSMLCRCLESGLTLRYFSCAAQEKKNHLQVFYAQEKTFKGGLRPAEVEESILMQEGRRILFIHKHASILAKNGFDVSALIESPKPLQIYLWRKKEKKKRRKNINPLGWLWIQFSKSTGRNSFLLTKVSFCGEPDGNWSCCHQFRWPPRNGLPLHSSLTKGDLHFQCTWSGLAQFHSHRGSVGFEGESRSLPSHFQRGQQMHQASLEFLISLVWTFPSAFQQSRSEEFVLFPLLHRKPAQPAFQLP